jgi:hypothetical protein
MCDPMSIAAAALTVAGVGAQAVGAGKARRAQSNVASAETARQRGYQAEQSALFDQTMAGQTREASDQRLSDATARRTNALQGAVTPGSVMDVPLAGNEASVVADTISRRLAESAQTARDEGGRLGALGAYKDLNLGNSIDLGRSGQQQGMFTGFSRGSSDLVPMEMDVAGHKGDNWASIGRLLGGLGTVTGMAGAYGLNPFKGFGSKLATTAGGLPSGGFGLRQ